MGTERGEAGIARTSVPDLRFYPCVVHRDYASGELDAACRSALGIEIVTYEPREHCGDEMSGFISRPRKCIHAISEPSEVWV